MQRLRIALFVALMSAGVLSGCGGAMSVGRDFDYKYFAARAQVGTTDAAQVREWLGEPASTGTEVAGEARLDVWTYLYGTGVVPGGASTRFKLLQVKLDPQGKLVGWNWSGEGAGTAVEEKSTGKSKS